MIVHFVLTEQTGRNQVLASRGWTTSGIRPLRLYVPSGPIPPRGQGPFSAAKRQLSDPFSCDLDARLTLFRLNHQRATTPRMTKAATTGPAMTPGLIDLPPELAGLGIHSIDGHCEHDLLDGV